MNTPPWRIVFFGTPSFAIPALQGLLEGPDRVVGVVTQPDREKGRGRKILSSPVKELALRHGLLLFQPEKVKEEMFQKALRDLQPDLFVVVAYGQILPKSMLTGECPASSVLQGGVKGHNIKGNCHTGKPRPLGRESFTIPRHGAVNVHASLLPQYRGAAPIAWAILNGEKKTGVTTMLMDEGMDTGDILLQSETLVGEEET